MTNSLDNTVQGDVIEFRDYVFIRGNRTTYTMIEQRVEEYRLEISQADKQIHAMSFTDETVKETSYELANYMGLIGSQLSRGYAMLREVNRLRDTISHKLEDLINEELSDPEKQLNIKGNNQKARDAYFATKYRMLYKSRRYLTDFANNELVNYINQLSTMDKVLSRQLSSLEFEYTAATR